MKSRPFGASTAFRERALDHSERDAPVLAPDREAGAAIPLSIGTMSILAGCVERIPQLLAVQSIRSLTRTLNARWA
jgi:hypothetical protein